MKNSSTKIWTIAASIAAFIVSLPLLTVFTVSFFSGESGAFQHLLSTVLPGYFIVTAKLACGVGCGVVLLGASTAWLVTAYDFPGRAVFNQLLIMPMAMPAYLIAIVYIELLDFAGPLQSALRTVFGW
ncbi:MAG: iron ABC transporter permease, partial [Desulfobacterales bacterium]